MSRLPPPPRPVPIEDYRPDGRGAWSGWYGRSCLVFAVVALAAMVLSAVLR